MSNMVIRPEDSIDKIDHFRREASLDIQRMLIAQVGKERATRAAAKIGLALASAIRSAKNPDAIMDCSRGSIVQCVAAACAVDLYPRTTNSPVWLIPKGGELQFWISHIGIATLAYRAGIALRPVPVHALDEIEVRFGDVIRHEPGDEPETLDQLQGVYVVVKRISDGAIIGTPWVSASLIAKRRKQGGPVWNAWPIEMAQKTAIKYLVNRGIVVIDVPELSMALDNEPAEDAGYTGAGAGNAGAIASRAAPEPNGAAELLGIAQDAELPGQDDYAEEAEAEPIEARPTPAEKPAARAAASTRPAGGRRAISRGAP